MVVGNHYSQMKKIPVAKKIIKQVITLLMMTNQNMMTMMIHMIQIATLRVKQIIMKVKILEMFMIGVKKILIEMFIIYPNIILLIIQPIKLFSLINQIILSLKHLIYIHLSCLNL